MSPRPRSTRTCPLFPSAPRVRSALPLRAVDAEDQADDGDDRQDAEHEADPQVAQQALVAQRAEGGEGLEQVAAVGQQLVRAAGERSGGVLRGEQIGRANVCTPVTNAHLVCRLLLEKKK